MLDGKLEFRDQIFSDKLTWNNAVIVDNAGNVGIGETSPGQKLQVNGNIRADGHIRSGSKQHKPQEQAVVQQV